MSLRQRRHLNFPYSLGSSVLTKEVHHESIVVAIDVGGRVGLELDGNISRGGVELEAGPRATILAQDLGG